MKEIPEKLLKQAIGICKCMQSANEASVSVRIMRMYAAESERISTEIKKYTSR